MVNTVLLNTDYKARRVEDYAISITCGKAARKILLLPEGRELPFTADGDTFTFKSENMKIFNMYKIQF